MESISAAGLVPIGWRHGAMLCIFQTFEKRRHLGTVF